MKSVRLWLVAGLLFAGCQREAEPLTVAKAFAAAMQARDANALLDLVDARARKTLEAAAERATDQIGGRREVGAYEMLQVVDVDPRFQVAKATLVEQSAEHATVRLDGVDGSTHNLSLVLEGGAWRVRVPTPKKMRLKE